MIKAKLNLDKNITINLNRKLLDIVDSVKLGYKEQGAKPIIIGQTTSDDVGDLISIDYWSAFAKPTRKLHIGDEFYFDNHKIIITEKVNLGKIRVKFELDNISIFEFQDKYGEMPLPLYIKLPEAQKSDNEHYQKVYSSVQGSVAAPTAGLHFTNDLIDKIKAKGVQTTFVTPHVGAGTFMPVKTENINEHKMHTEYCSIAKS